MPRERSWSLRSSGAVKRGVSCLRCAKMKLLGRSRDAPAVPLSVSAASFGAKSRRCFAQPVNTRCCNAFRMRHETISFTFKQNIEATKCFLFLLSYAFTLPAGSAQAKECETEC